MSQRIARLLDHWERRGIRRAPPSAPADLTRFESRFAVRLPGDLREYFLVAGGMDLAATNAPDDAGFSLWPLPDLTPAAQGLSARGVVGVSLSGLDGLFLFADYLGFSWAYAIDLQNTADRPNPVVLLGRETPVPIADSFSHFVDFYLADAPQLYG